MSQMTFSGPTLDTSAGVAGAKPGGEPAAPSRAAARKAGAGKPGDQRPMGPKKIPVVKAPTSGATYPGTGRNAPCPCGSGKKYKLCHGKGEA
jgi:preprotein translocase subunit SecA